MMPENPMGSKRCRTHAVVFDVFEDCRTILRQSLTDSYRLRLEGPVVLGTRLTSQHTARVMLK